MGASIRRSSALAAGFRPSLLTLLLLPAFVPVTASARQAATPPPQTYSGGETPQGYRSARGSLLMRVTTVSPSGGPAAVAESGLRQVLATAA